MFSDEAAAGDVGHALDHARLEQGREGLDVDLGGGEQHVAGWPPSSSSSVSTV